MLIFNQSNYRKTNRRRTSLEYVIDEIDGVSDIAGAIAISVSAAKRNRGRAAFEDMA
jgi:hypothetical protein